MGGLIIQMVKVSNYMIIVLKQNKKSNKKLKEEKCNKKEWTTGSNLFLI